ncbi:GGDEF domain-containing protein [Cognatilysobacter segetis]|uniref:GGDEF domain-containing protein n=1 Tax=Cognatilysobacter segetis TaxID=2492394 RepID=UPI00105E0AEE|nr:GGDEF domain-containing protein [Lysobacter segetis]
MQPIDMMSALVTGGTGGFIAAALMRVAMQTDRSLRRPLLLCFWGFLVLGIGLSQNAFSDRALRWPMFAGATATLVCTVLVSRGLLAIAAGRVLRHPAWVDVALAVGLLAVAWPQGPWLFGVVFHAACAAISTAVAVVLGRSLATRRSAAETVVAATFALYAATWVYGLWTAARYHGPELRHLLYMPEPMLSVYAVADALLPLVVGALVLNLANARLGARLHRQASTDELTRLLSRRAINERARPFLERAVARGRGVALLLVDADRFKHVNDTHGHEAGDAVLAELAGRLQALLPGALVSRYGGEEFLVLLETASLDAARAAAERLRAGIADAPVPVGTRDLAVTVSTGLALWPPSAEFGAVLRRADAALYEAKRTGRDRVVDFEADAAPLSAWEAAAPGTP